MRYCAGLAGLPATQCCVAWVRRPGRRVGECVTFSRSARSTVSATVKSSRSGCSRWSRAVAIQTSTAARILQFVTCAPQYRLSIYMAHLVQNSAIEITAGRATTVTGLEVCRSSTKLRASGVPKPSQGRTKTVPCDALPRLYGGGPHLPPRPCGGCFLPGWPACGSTPSARLRSG